MAVSCQNLMLQNSKRNFLSDKTIILSWISSYIIIISIPILIACILLVHSLNYMQQENRKLCQSELQNLSDIMDSYFIELRHIAQEFSLDPETVFLATTKNATNQKHYTYYEVQQQMKHYVSSNNYIQNMGIVFPNEDLVLSNLTLGPFSQFHRQLPGTWLLDSLSQGEFQHNYYYLSDYDTFAYVLSLPYDVNAESNCYYYIVLKPEIWQMICENQKENTFQVSINYKNDTSVSTPPPGKIWKQEILF